jgi:uncharacterized small protein (DUF1192 family)
MSEALAIFEIIQKLIELLKGMGVEIDDLQAAVDAEIARIKTKLTADEAGDVAAMGLKPDPKPPSPSGSGFTF